MKNTILFALLAFNIAVCAQPCKEIIGYYPNWQWYDRSKLVNPTSINYNKYSIINYCFFKPETNGTITNTDSWADENLLQGQINWSTTPVSYYPNTSIIERAHNAGTKVMVSIGGWTLSDNFPSIAASSTKRTTFASECNRLIRFYNFDGIDIDWEYPGFVEHSGTTADKQNFTLLMQEIKDSLTALGNARGKTYLLSSCFSADPAKAQDIEWQNIVPILDMINVMSYDFFGAFDCIANHNSPLFAPTSGNPNFNLDACFKMLTQNYNVPSNKINLGVAFYGRSQMGASALHQTTNCTANTSLFAVDEGTPLYYNTLANISQFDSYWDSNAQVPYLLGKTGTAAQGTFVSYDNTVSIGLKAQYVKDNNARGVIIWEITGDYIESGAGTGIVQSTPLVDTLNQVFCSSSVGINQSNKETTFSIFPNPSNDKITVRSNDSYSSYYTINTILGKEIANGKVDSEECRIDISDLSAGVYFLNLLHNNKWESLKLIRQ
jgi:chitinase